MKTTLSLVVAVAAVQLVAASVIRGPDDYMKELGAQLMTSPMFPDELKHIFAPADPEAPAVDFPEPEVNKVVVQAEEHTDEEVEEHDPEIQEYNPSTDIGENFIVTPEEEIAKLADEAAAVEAAAEDGKAEEEDKTE